MQARPERQSLGCANRCRRAEAVPIRAADDYGYFIHSCLPFRKPHVSLPSLDGDEALGRGPSYGDVGMIKVQLVRVREGCQKAFRPREDCSDVGPVHEKSKKGGSHCVSYVLMLEENCIC